MPGLGGGGEGGGGRRVSLKECLEWGNSRMMVVVELRKRNVSEKSDARA